MCSRGLRTPLDASSRSNFMRKVVSMPFGHCSRTHCTQHIDQASTDRCTTLHSHARRHARKHEPSTANVTHPCESLPSDELRYPNDHRIQQTHGAPVKDLCIPAHIHDHMPTAARAPKRRSAATGKRLRGGRRDQSNTSKRVFKKYTEADIRDAPAMQSKTDRSGDARRAKGR